MNRCLCCGKPLKASAKTLTWHPACIKKFFGTGALPELDLSDEVLRQLVQDSTARGYTVPGVQKKLSLHLTEADAPRLTLVNYPTGYILKPQADEFTALPETEYLIMQMAQASGIKTVPYALLRLPSESGGFAYITKRIDRLQKPVPAMLAMEDFCQLDGRLTEDKYRGSYERCAKIVSKYSTEPGLDLSELYLRVVFSFAVGNSDMHLKNFSLVETAENSREYRLSAAYDLLSTNVVLPFDREQLALTLNGKKQNIRRKDFLVFADTIGISQKSAEKMIAKLASLKEKYIEMCGLSYMPEDRKADLNALMDERIGVLMR